jgi:hypothetical protein
VQVIINAGSMNKIIAFDKVDSLVAFMVFLFFSVVPAVATFEFIH